MDITLSLLTLSIGKEIIKKPSIAYFLLFYGENLVKVVKAT